MTSINIRDFSTEVLLHIFQYCNVYDLCRLRRTCKRFNIIIRVNRIALHECDALATNQIKCDIRLRSKMLLDPYEKWRISHNWKIGRFKLHTLLKKRERLMPWLQLDSEYLWVSEGKYIKAFSRTKNTINEKEATYNITDGTNHDVVRFRVNQSKVVCGQRNGGLFIWSLNERNIIVNIPQCHTGDVTSVDIKNDIFISASFDKTLKIWPLAFEAHIQPISRQNINDRIWSIGISPSQKYVAVGSGGFYNAPLHIYDLDRFEPYLLLGQNLTKGAGILDLHWEDENVLLTCGYDTFLRKWDLRTGRNEQKWEDPHDATFYCLSSDDLFTVICGTSVYGRVVLWDQRKTDYVQMYYTCSNKTSSPVYSISFDGSQLYTALDRCVCCLDFTNHRGQIKNYTDLYAKFCKLNV